MMVIQGCGSGFSELFSCNGALNWIASHCVHCCLSAISRLMCELSFGLRLGCLTILRARRTKAAEIIQSSNLIMKSIIQTHLSLPCSDAHSDPILLLYLVDTRDYRGQGAFTWGSPSVFCLMFEQFESYCMLPVPISLVTSLPHDSSHHIESIMSNLCRKTI